MLLNSKNETVTIGWIGTGLMGSPMAGHLLNAGYKLNITNRTKAKAEELIKAGCAWKDTPGAVAASSDVTVTMIGSPADVERCYFGQDGIFEGVNKGSILIDMTTTKPSLATKIDELSKSRGVDFVDAPVSGGQVGAINANLSIMIGGNREVVQSLLPLFEVFGKNIVYQGSAGSGQHTKMCNQITIASTIVGVCEGLIYGRKAGLDLNTLLSSISKGAAACWSLDVLAPKIVKADWSPGFSIDNFVKDLTIALDEADRMKLSLPGLALAKQLYVAIQAMGKGAAGNQTLYLAIEKLCNMNIEYRTPNIE
jgi:3-hydroxyisobutyrate dehydrogenase